MIEKNFLLKKKTFDIFKFFFLKKDFLFGGLQIIPELGTGQCPDRL